MTVARQPNELQPNLVYIQVQYRAQPPWRNPSLPRVLNAWTYVGLRFCSNLQCAPTPVRTFTFPACFRMLWIQTAYTFCNHLLTTWPAYWMNLAETAMHVAWMHNTQKYVGTLQYICTKALFKDAHSTISIGLQWHFVCAIIACGAISVCTEWM